MQHVQQIRQIINRWVQQNGREVTKSKDDNFWEYQQGSEHDNMYAPSIENVWEAFECENEECEEEISEDK